MRALPFVKMHGLGNDFVVLDARREAVALTPRQRQILADRRRGIGCDQLITLEPPRAKGADIFMRIHNPDGSEAESCGNATRCIAAKVMGETGRDALVVETLGGRLDARRTVTGEIAVDMGEPALDWQSIPVAAPCDTLHMPLALGPLADPVGVNMGNPHAVFFVPDAEAIDLGRWGPQLETHAFFPEKANIEIVAVVAPDRLRLRVWERAAGITQACGSGACAALVAAHRRGLVGRRVRIDLDGGPLVIEWRGDNHVVMTGGWAESYRGAVDLAALEAGHG